MYKAVLWDFGGVMTSSPFEAFNRFEKANNLPMDFIRGINATNPETNAWAQLESAQIDVVAFDALFAEEARLRDIVFEARTFWHCCRVIFVLRWLRHCN